MIIDTHCHLSYEDYGNKETIDKVVKNMAPNLMIISGVDDETNKEVMQYIEEYDNVYGMIGIHPSEVDNISERSFDYIESCLQHSKIVAVGEIGLDYHYPEINKDKQKQYFEKQILLAKKYKKPIVIHSRDAYQDTYEILKKYNDHSMKIVMHCYSYSLESARELVKLGVKFGIGGVLTFKNSKKLREVVENLDLSNFILETDSPYLSPEPYRGTKNEPKNVILVAEKLAEIKNITFENVVETTTATAIHEFDLPIKL